jgi:hypothetical protein
LDRASGYEPEGREFESLRARQLDQGVGSANPFFFGGVCRNRAMTRLIDHP